MELHPDVYKNVKSLTLQEAFDILAVIHHKKMYVDNPVIQETIKILKQHIFEIGRKNYAEEDCS